MGESFMFLIPRIGYLFVIHDYISDSAVYRIISYKYGLYIPFAVM